MYLRISRLPFVLVRCCFLSIVLLFIFEIKLFYNHDNSAKKSPMEISFWQKLYDQDQLLTQTQRVKQIEIAEKQILKTQLNWTTIFYDIYQRKLQRLNQRDARTLYKYRTIEKQENFSQTKFEIFEETPVRRKYLFYKHLTIVISFFFFM